MFKQGLRPYFVCGPGYMNAIALKYCGIAVEKSSMGIEKTAPGLGCYCFYVNVEAGDSVVWKMGEVHGEQAVYKNV